MLSTPNLMIQNGEEGEIRVGDQVPTLLSRSVSEGGTSVTSIDYRSTGLTMKVKPFVDGREQVRLQISASIESASENDTSGIDSPIVSQRSVDTTITSRDRQTIILGGLRRQSQDTSKTGLPIVRNIPFLKEITGRHAKGAEETELVILLTPRIVSGMADLSKISNEALSRVVAAQERLGRFQ